MFEDIKEITCSDLSSFLSPDKISVLRVRSGNELGFNRILKTLLEKDKGSEFVFATLNTNNVDYENEIIQLLIGEWMEEIGLPTSCLLPSGYYLFKNGKLIGHHSATIDLKNIHPQAQAITTIMSLVAGLLVGILEKDTLKGLETFADTFEAPQSWKVYEFFKKLLGEEEPSHSKAEQKAVYEDELTKAYNTLQVHKNATDREIFKARNILVLKYHPDKHPEDNEKYTIITAGINEAYAIIMNSRKTSN